MQTWAKKTFIEKELIGLAGGNVSLEDTQGKGTENEPDVY